MKKLKKEDLCINKPYINLKKLPVKVTFKVGEINETGLKNTYLIDQQTNSLSKNQNYSIEYEKGIEKHTYFQEELHGNLLVEVSHLTKGDKTQTKYKVYLIEDGIKYALPFTDFEDVYNYCNEILVNELNESNELKYILLAFNDLIKEEFSVDLNLNLERLSDYKDKVNYKRNVNYFVINNIPQATSKYDIRNYPKAITTSDTLHILRYNYKERLYYKLKDSTISLQDTDIIVDLMDEGFPKVSIFMSYGLGKLLDLKNNVIPNSNTISLFANILDLDINALN
ncbi:MAG: hypothetical protein ACRCW0_07330 [Clostridium sp.]